MAKAVLLTGVTGFIAKHIARGLLECGYLVIGSLRDPDRQDEVRQAMASTSLVERLKFVSLDLLSDEGWDTAMQGVDCVIHTASPFPMSLPKHEDDLICPAVEGTKRVLQSAHRAGVNRVVLTSSMVAIMFAHRSASHAFGPDDWTDLSHPAITPYAKSKTLAERAAWDWADKHSDLELTVLNPGLVLGTPLDTHFGTSLRVIERLLAGRDPVIPNIGIPLVDIEDVARLHVQALDTPASIGRRFVVAECFNMLPGLARHLQKALDNPAITTRVAPKPLLGLMSLFDPNIRSFMPQVGRRIEFDNAATVSTFGLNFKSGLAAAETTARYFSPEHAPPDKKRDHG